MQPPNRLSNPQLAAYIGAIKASPLEARAYGLSEAWKLTDGRVVSTIDMRRISFNSIAYNTANPSTVVPYSEFVEFWAATHDIDVNTAARDPDFIRWWQQKENSRRALKGTRGRRTPEKDSHIAALVNLGVLEKKNGHYGYTTLWINFILRERYAA